MKIRNEKLEMRNYAGIIDFSTYVHNNLCKGVDKMRKSIFLLGCVDKEFHNIKLYTSYTQAGMPRKCMINKVNMGWCFELLPYTHSLL